MTRWSRSSISSSLCHSEVPSLNTPISVLVSTLTQTYGWGNVLKQNCWFPVPLTSLSPISVNGITINPGTQATSTASWSFCFHSYKIQSSLPCPALWVSFFKRQSNHLLSLGLLKHLNWNPNSYFSSHASYYPLPPSTQHSAFSPSWNPLSLFPPQAEDTVSHPGMLFPVSACSCLISHPSLPSTVTSLKMSSYWNQTHQSPRSQVSIL